MSASLENPITFVRTRLTWQAYLTIGYYSYLLNSLGPLTPFLRSELNLSYTVASFHFSAYALGVIVTGVLLNPAVRRFGARFLVWTGVFGMALGTLLLILGHNPFVTIPGAFLMGLLGALISALLSMALVEQHGLFRAVALAESTMIASLFSSIAPVSIGFFARTALTWRAALAAMLLAVPVLWLVYRKDVITRADQKHSVSQPAVRKQRARLPFIYWIYWVLILLVEAIEFCIILWAADYLENVNGLSKADAALGLSAFMGSMMFGRWLVSRLLRRSKEYALLMVSLLTSAAGFLLFWLSPNFAGFSTPAALMGLLLAGLGVAGQYPIMNALALSTVPDQMVEGSGRISLAVGSAILLLPLALGRLADWFGIRAAYSIEFVLLGLAFALLLWAGKLSARHQGPAKPF